MRNSLKIFQAWICGWTSDPPSPHDTIRDLRAQVHQLEAQLNRCEAEKERLPRELTPEDCIYQEHLEEGHQ